MISFANFHTMCIGMRLWDLHSQTHSAMTFKAFSPNRRTVYKEDYPINGVLTCHKCTNPDHTKDTDLKDTALPCFALPHIQFGNKSNSSDGPRGKETMQRRLNNLKNYFGATHWIVVWIMWPWSPGIRFFLVRFFTADNMCKWHFISLRIYIYIYISPSAQDTNWYHLGGQRFVMFFGDIYVSKARKYMMDFSGV